MSVSREGTAEASPCTHVSFFGTSTLTPAIEHVYSVAPCLRSHAPMHLRAVRVLPHGAPSVHARAFARSSMASWHAMCGLEHPPTVKDRVSHRHVSSGALWALTADTRTAGAHRTRTLTHGGRRRAIERQQRVIGSRLRILIEPVDVWYRACRCLVDVWILFIQSRAWSRVVQAYSPTAVRNQLKTNYLAIT